MQTKPKFNLLRSSELLPLLLIVFVFALAYLPRIDQFGFYKDDWHMIYNGHTFGPNRITDSFLIDRPMMGRLNTLTYRVLGDSPLAWSLFAFAARLEGVLAFYALLRLLWPARRYPAVAMTLLFAVYPGFLQLPNAATFQNHFVGYGLALTSIALTVAVLRARMRVGLKVLLTGIAVLFTAGYLLIYEYMIGLEALRLLVIWLALRPAGQPESEPGDLPRTPWKQSIGRALLIYLPYLLVALGFLAWRLFIFSSERPATNTELLLGKYLTAPGAMAAQLLADLVKDFAETLWLAWGVPLYTLWSEARPADLAVGLLLGAFAAAAVVLYARRFRQESGLDGQVESGREWIPAALVAGVLSIIAALLPVLAAGRSVAFKDQFDRYTLHATAGVALVWGGLLFYALRPRLRLAALALLVGLAIPTHTLNAAYWSQFWTVQREFWWQMTWRAPMLEDQTVLMPLLPTGYRLAEDYEVFSAANLVYHPDERAFNIYGEVLNADTARKVALGEEGYRFIRFFEMTRDFKKALIVYWPGGGSCAHFIDGERLELSRQSDPLLFWVGRYSRIQQVAADAPSPQPLAVVFGPEPRHGWCFYYQQADLARQRGDWQAAASLYDQAEAAGLAPLDTLEWLPFYEAFFNLGDRERAGLLAGRIRNDFETTANYCRLTLPRTDPAAAALCELP